MTLSFLPLVLVFLSPPTDAAAPAAPAKVQAVRADRPAPRPARGRAPVWTPPVDEHGLFVLASAGGVTPRGLGMGSGSAFRVSAGWSFGRIAAEASVQHAELAAPAAAAVNRVQHDELAIGARVAVLRADGGRAEGLLLASVSPRATVRSGDVWYEGVGASVGGGLRIRTEHRVFLDAEATWHFVRLTSGQTQENGLTERHRFARPKALDGLAVLVGAGLQF